MKTFYKELVEEYAELKDLLTYLDNELLLTEPIFSTTCECSLHNFVDTKTTSDVSFFLTNSKGFVKCKEENSTLLDFCNKTADSNSKYVLVVEEHFAQFANYYEMTFYQ